MKLPIKTFEDYNTYYPLIQKIKIFMKISGFKILEFDI